MASFTAKRGLSTSSKESVPAVWTATGTLNALDDVLFGSVLKVTTITVSPSIVKHFLYAKYILNMHVLISLIRLRNTCKKHRLLDHTTKYIVYLHLRGVATGSSVMLTACGRRNIP